MPPRKIRLSDAACQLERPWTPAIVGTLNGQYVKLAIFDGEHVWHHHADADEGFMVLDGEVVIHFRDGALPLRAGELCVVPRGVAHKPTAERRALVLLFEPIATRSTGDVDAELTVEASDLIDLTQP